MKVTFVIVVSLALTAGAFAVNGLGAQTTGTSESGVPPALTVQTQDPSTPLPPATTPTPPATAPTTTTPPDATTPTGDGSATVPGTAGVTVQNIVEITRLVPAGTTAVSAFTVPAGVVLILTDLLVTNTGTAATCGGAVNRTGTTTAAPPTPTTPTPSAPTGTTDAATSAAPGSAATTSVAGTVTETDSTVTGPLCIPAQTTTALPLTTGIEFAAGQTVQLMNTPDPAAPGAAPGALGFHLRGLLVRRT